MNRVTRLVQVFALVPVILLTLMVPAVLAATITVNSLDDPGAKGICALRDAITAANTHKAVHKCTAGTGADMVRFSVTGIINLTNPLQVTDRSLIINGPHVTLNGGGKVQILQVLPAAKLTIKNLSLEGGFTDDEGGAISNGGKLTVANCGLTGNYSSSDGGAIFNTGKLTITRSTIANNSSSQEAGGIGNENIGTMIIVNSTVVSNQAGTDGDGNCDVCGGIDNWGTMRIFSSTIAGNRVATSDNCAGQGPGIASSLRLAATVNLKNTIVADNVIDILDETQNCIGGFFTDAGYNISDDNSCGFNATGSQNSTNPMLDPNGLQNNGGPTQTIALLPGSPAIDVIPLASCTGPNDIRIIIDQRGFPRPGARETMCSIGAYEFQD